MFIFNINIHVTKGSSSSIGDDEVKKKREVGSLEEQKTLQLKVAMLLILFKVSELIAKLLN